MGPVHWAHSSTLLRFVIHVVIIVLVVLPLLIVRSVLLGIKWLLFLLVLFQQSFVKLFVEMGSETLVRIVMMVTPMIMMDAHISVGRKLVGPVVEVLQLRKVHVLEGSRRKFSWRIKGQCFCQGR
jgi:hypothetical protein